MSQPVTRRQFLITGTCAALAAPILRAQEPRLMPTIAANGRSDYRIAIPDSASPSQIHAAEELASFIRQMTDAELRIVTDAEALPEKAILLGNTRHTAEVLGAKPGYEALGDDGFHIRTVPPHVVVAAGPVRGTLYGAYELLERYWGCRWYATFHSVIPKHDTLTLPDIDDTQVPAFAMREPYWWEMFDGDNAARNRANGNRMRLEEKHGGKIRFGGGLFVHTFYRLVPPDEFFAEHPEYYSLIDGERRVGMSQLCLTNPDVLRIVAERVLERIREDPGAKLFSVSQNDWDGHCQCYGCMEIEKREESPAGTLIWFVNQVAEAVEREFPDVWIETLAYQYTRKPPKHIRPRGNVVPRLCTIECDFSVPLDESAYEQNRRFVSDIRGWSAMTDMLYIWDYTTNFHNYIGPHPNFPALPANVRFFRDNHVVGLFEQGDAEAPHAEFGELRAWLLAKLLWNPDQPVEPLYDDFFAGYYGAAAGPIRRYFDELQRLPREAGATLRIFDSLRNPWLSLEFVERAEALWAEAERLAAGDPGLLYRVRMSGIPVLWARLRVMDQPQRRYVVNGGRLALGELDPAYGKAGAELLRRIDEGKVRIREYIGYHTQALIDLTGEIEGFPLTLATSGGARVGVATGCGGSAVVWTLADGPSLLSPELGGVEVVNRHEELERPDLTEWDDAGRSGDSISISAKEPIAVWGPQPKERLGVARTMSVAGRDLAFTEICSMQKQSREVSLAVRVALRLDTAGPVMVSSGDGFRQVLSLPNGEETGTLSLPAEALALREYDIAPVADGGNVRVTLPDFPYDSLAVHLDRGAGAAVLLATIPTRTIEPGGSLAVTVRLTAN